MFSGDFGARLKGSFLSDGGNKKKTGQDNNKKPDGSKKEEAKVPVPKMSSLSLGRSPAAMKTVPLRDLPTDVLLPIFEKADLPSLVKMQMASTTVNNLVEENKKEIFKHRQDKIHLCIPIETTRFMMSVNRTILTNPAKQLYGMEVEKSEIYFGVKKANASTMKGLLSTVKTMTKDKEKVDEDLEKYPLCGVLYILRKAEVLFRGSVKDNLDRLVEELVKFPHLRLLPHFTIEEHCTTPLPMYFPLVWTTPLDYEYVRINKLPVDIHVMMLPSDNLLIGFNHSIDLKPGVKPSPFADDKWGQVLKVWIVKKDTPGIESAVKKAFPDNGKHTKTIAEIVKNTNTYLAKPDDWVY